jgi:hypothetical protein
MCTAYPLQQIAEPGTNATFIAPVDPTYPLLGYADNHLHMLGHMAMGGGTIAGEAWDPINGVNGALAEDYGTFLTLVDFNDAQLPVVTCPSFLLNCGSVKLHEFHDLLDGDSVGNSTQDQAGGSNYGAPTFGGWPQWNSTTHEQVYYKWLERAYQGGLRLITLMTSTNEALCRGDRHLVNTKCTDSMAGVDEQIVAAYQLQCFIDGNSTNGDTNTCSYYVNGLTTTQALANIATNPLALQDGPGWFRIVRTPALARAQIAKGNLAVTLGIEVDNLFDAINLGRRRIPTAIHSAAIAAMPSSPARWTSMPATASCTCFRYTTSTTGMGARPPGTRTSR